MVRHKKTEMCTVTFLQAPEERSAGSAGKDSPFSINGTNHFSEDWKLSGKEERAQNAEDTADHRCLGRSDGARKAAGEETAEGDHSHEGHGIETHHPSALILVHNGLEQRVCGCHLNHHSEPCDDHHGRGQPKNTRKRKTDQPDSEEGRSNDDDAAQAEDTPSRGQETGRLPKLRRP